SSRRRHTSFSRDWSSDVCSSDLARGIDGTDAQIAEAYAMWWSDELYAAGWMSVGDTAPPSFVGWVEREWLAPASGEPSGADAARSEERRVGKEGRARRSGGEINE